MAVTSASASPFAAHFLRAAPRPAQQPAGAPRFWGHKAPSSQAVSTAAPWFTPPAPWMAAVPWEPREVAPGPSFQAVTAVLVEARKHPEVAKRHEFIKYVNACVAPRLTMEEAYLQWLCMRMIRVYTPPHARLRVNVRHDRHGQPVACHGSELVHAEVTRDNVNGGVAHLFEPGFWGKYKNKHDAIIAFGGTAAKLLGAGGDVLLEDGPQGLRADVDRGGVGKTAFEANKLVWLGWARRVLARGQRLTIVGYSLGGAMATRLMAELSAEEQMQCRLFTFQAPGVDAATADRLVPGRKNVVMVDNPGDMITQVGAKHPDGILVETRMPPGADLRRPHMMPSLVAAQLDGLPATFVEFDRPHRTSRALEGLRQVVGLAYPHLPG